MAKKVDPNEWLKRLRFGATQTWVAKNGELRYVAGIERDEKKDEITVTYAHMDDSGNMLREPLEKFDAWIDQNSAQMGTIWTDPAAAKPVAASKPLEPAKV